MSFPAEADVPLDFLHPYPEIYLLGAMRGGTTFLHDALVAHPGVVAGATKELQFFTLHWQRGVRFYRSQLPRRWPVWMYAPTGQRRPLAIDSSPYYLFHPDVPERLCATAGAAVKCIVLLREPVARAWSHYRMMLGSGREHLGFLEAIEREVERVSESVDTAEAHQLPPHMGFSYVARGMYADQLQRWWGVVPREQFLLLRSEDLYRDAAGTFATVCDFLELERVPLPASSGRNDAPRADLPPDVRSILESIYAEPNQRLGALTGITW